MLFFLSSPSIAQTPEIANTDLLKVAYVYNFSHYFTWPDHEKWTNSANLNICIHDNSFTQKAFLSLNGRSSQDKTIQIVSLVNDTININKTCHIWFIDQSNYAEQRSQLLNIPNSGVLTIVDFDNKTNLGAIVEFVEEDSRLKFKINIELADAQDLKASSLVLELGISDE